MGKQEVYAQGSLIWIKEHHIKICFVYLREKPTELELKKISNHWKSCDLIIGDLNIKPNLSQNGSECNDNSTWAT